MFYEPGINISLIKEEIIFFNLLQTLSEVKKNTFEFNQSLLGCKFISWSVIRLWAYFGSKVVFHKPWNN